MNTAAVSARGALRGASPLLAGVALLLLGSGLTGTLLGVRAHLEGFRPGVIGIVLAGYYIGYVAGSYFAPPAIVRVGHIRVFSGLAGLASAAILVHLVLVDPVSWFLLRVIVGLSVSALYVVVESWMNGITTNRSRGALFAVYMIVVSASLLGGQVLYAVMGARGFEPFVIAAVLVSLAVVPVTLSVFPAPSLPRPAPLPVRTVFRIAPLAVIGTAAAGFISQGMLSAGVVYATQAGFDDWATGAFIGAALVGGMALQFPLGAWSDRVDRRMVIAIAAVAAGVVAVVASQVADDRRLVLIALTTVAGGTAYPIYSLSVAHLNDYIDDDLKVAAVSKVVLVNGIGAIAGPIAGAFMISKVSPGSMFLLFAGAYGVVGADALFRMTRRSAAEEAERARFVPFAVGGGPRGAPAETDAFPPTVGDAPFGDLVVRYTEWGSGPPFVLIGDAEGSGGRPWDGVALPLAADGLRVIVPELGSRRDDGDDVAGAILAVLRHLKIASVGLAGVDSGVAIAQRFATANADRVDALVLAVAVEDLDIIGVAAELAHPTLRVDRTRLATEPSDLADDIAEFTRPVAATMAVHWETGQIESIDA